MTGEVNSKYRFLGDQDGYCRWVMKKWDIVIVRLVYVWVISEKDCVGGQFCLARITVVLSLDGFLLGMLLVVIRIPLDEFLAGNILDEFVLLRSVYGRGSNGHLRRHVTFRRFLPISPRYLGSIDREKDMRV